ncbi:twin-arginine translocase TatA/TatE family subunit [Rhodoplanes sp. SY1]|uniref:twin-arginine translocase TatA/TatE family subunit n=1 Tax=Rhodoplanes sp. SY1 TaxID=3166646 RepID=UPI0038B4DC30
MNIFGLGAPEIALILFVLLLFFGKDKLPGLARSIGRSFKELKSGFADGLDADEREQKPKKS